MKLVRFLLAVCLMPFAALAASSLAGPVPDSGTPVVLLKGLLMLGLDNHDALQIGFPKAAGHAPTITVVMKNGEKRVIPVRRIGTLTSATPATTPAVIEVPELVRMREIYGEKVVPHLESAEHILSIPWSSIRSVRTQEVTPLRYTFVRADNGVEIETFRPRQLAEVLRVDLSSSATLEFDHQQQTIDLAGAKEIWIDYSPHILQPGQYEEHFVHFLPYIMLPGEQKFDVIPRSLSGTSEMPHIGSFFIPPTIPCTPVGMP